MLRKSQVLQLITDMLATNDDDLLEDDLHLPEEICKRDDRIHIRNILMLVKSLWHNYDYLKSNEAQLLLKNKSNAYRNYYSKSEQGESSRSHRREDFGKALVNILESKYVYELVPQEDHSTLDAIRSLIEQTKNP